MEQLLCHLFGDYIIQSNWMANNKTKSHFAAFAHAATYALPFLLLQPSLSALFVIVSTHFFIDRYRLARYLVWAKNYLWARCESAETHETLEWENCRATGYPSQTPDWLAVWLLIIADNSLHLAINFLALKYLS